MTDIHSLAIDVCSVCWKNCYRFGNFVWYTTFQLNLILKFIPNYGICFRFFVGGIGLKTVKIINILVNKKKLSLWPGSPHISDSEYLSNVYFPKTDKNLSGTLDYKTYL